MSHGSNCIDLNQLKVSGVSKFWLKPDTCHLKPTIFLILKPPMNPENDILIKLTRVTHEPGVYLMKDTAGAVIYVGKARNLKKRLASYFKNSGQFA